jgi:hypothetical protein
VGQVQNCRFLGALRAANVGVYSITIPAALHRRNLEYYMVAVPLVPQQYRAYAKVFRIAGFYRHAHVTEVCW